jgi:SAM-dependent methyltransferase
MAASNDRSSLKLFFHERASQIGASPTRDELSFVSGRDPRLWRCPGMYDDLLISIREQLGLEGHHTLLEVGCAAGFLAGGLAPLCREYTGLDLAPSAINKARTLGLRNAVFRVGDATALRIDADQFDRALSYDVFTNFAGFDLARTVIDEMLRVVKPGGRVLIGSLPDVQRSKEHEETAQRITAALEREQGPVAAVPGSRPGFRDRFGAWYLRRIVGARPCVTCYSFDRRDFEEFGRTRGIRTRVLPIHPLNPYHGLRFNVLFDKPAR